jgi:hypothetical protein
MDQITSFHTSAKITSAIQSQKNLLKNNIKVFS